MIEINKKPFSSGKGLFVALLGIEPKSQAPETRILSIVL